MAEKKQGTAANESPKIPCSDYSSFHSVVHKTVDSDVPFENGRAYVEVLKREFFNRQDIVAVKFQDKYPMHGWTNDLESLLMGHIYGKLVPATTFFYKDKKGNQREWHGYFRVGAHNISTDGTAKWVCIDFDGAGHSCPLADPLGAVVIVHDIFYKLGLRGYLEKSGGGSGFHLWYFFDPAAAAGDVRSFFLNHTPKDLPLAENKDGRMFADAGANKGVEIFPKQTQATKKWGNLVWLPWWHGGQNGGAQFFHLERGDA